ncbi:MAG: hypothetical protein Q4D79_02180 [Propionibacteriaceae bacterium]|nr:hypothetical protein [Propionibacteriaceae bacterium]
MTAVLGFGFTQRWRGALAVVVALFALLLLGLATVQGLNQDVYSQLPPEMLALAGIPSGADPAVMGYGQMLGFLGAVTVAGFAVAVGAQLVAGEERDQTLHLVLGQPVSRTVVALAKAGVLVGALAIVGAALWGVAEATAVLLGLELGETHLAELCLALTANALLCGSLAFAVGAATGRPGLASGIGAATVALGWLFAGLLPLSSETADLVDFVPWSWYSKPEVLVGGLEGGRLALQLGVATVLLMAGVVVFARRDLTVVGARPVPRVRGRSRAAAPGPLWLGLTRHAGLWLVLGATMFGVMGLLMGPVYEQMRPNLASMNAALPPELLQVWGAGDMSTPAGFYWGETMGLVAPAAVILAGAAVAGALGDDERSGRLGLVLSARGSRLRALGVAVAAQVLAVTLVAGLTGFGVWGGSALGDMGLDRVHIAGAAAHLAALGLLSAAVSLLAMAAFGSRAAATWAAVVFGLAGYMVYTTLPMNPSLAGWARISPFYYYASAQPLADGANWGHVAALAAAAVALWAVAAPLLTRRDLRR